MERMEILSLEKTTVFEPIRKKKKNLLIFPIIIITIIMLYPFIRDNFLITPKSVFNKSIDYISNLIVDNVHENSLYTANLKIDTENPDLKMFNNYTLGISGGINTSNKILTSKIYLKDYYQEYSYELIAKNNNLFHKFSNYETLIKYGSLEEDIFGKLQNINREDLKYLIKKSLSELKNNMKEENFTKENVTKNINGKDVKMIKCEYKLNEKEEELLIKNVYNNLMKDEKAKEIITKYDIKPNIKYTEPIDISIYVKDGRFSGLETCDISYFKDNEFDLKIKSYHLKGDKKEINIFENDELIGHISVHEFNKNKITFDYNIKETKGTVYYTNKKDNNMNISNIKISINDNTSLDMEIKEEYNKLQDINTDDFIALDNENTNLVINDFLNSLEKTPIGELIKYF